MLGGSELKGVAIRAATGQTGGTMGHLISGVVMAAGFLVGFLPLYTGFLDRLGGYDRHFAVSDGRLDRAEKDISSIQADVKSGNADTRTRLDGIIDQIHATHDLILTTKGAK